MEIDLDHLSAVPVDSRNLVEAEHFCHNCQSTRFDCHLPLLSCMAVIFRAYTLSANSIVCRVWLGLTSVHNSISGILNECSNQSVLEIYFNLGLRKYIFILFGCFEIAKSV
jgi:hypothetical protein